MIAVIDTGNVRSVAKAFQRFGEVRITTDPRDIEDADRIVLPGVGAFANCMNIVRPLIESLQRASLYHGKPFLGICVGMQLLADRSDEGGVHPGLSWIPGEITRIANSGVKVPHVGWNDLSPCQEHPLLEGVTHAYFTHSYNFSRAYAPDILATVDYGGELVAAVARGNIVGVQFHPEKSQESGLRFIKNFMEWSP